LNIPITPTTKQEHFTQSVQILIKRRRVRDFVNASALLYPTAIISLEEAAEALRNLGDDMDPGGNPAILAKFAAAISLGPCNPSACIRVSNWDKVIDSLRLLSAGLVDQSSGNLAVSVG
jgi:hypothetical protein